MKKYLLLIFFFPLFCKGQVNLVLNPDFEFIYSCPNDLHDFSKFYFWQNPTIASPSIFNNCNTTNAGVPINYGGFQQAFSGFGYAGIVVFHPDYGNREYIQVELLSSLVANSKYRISFYVSLADSSSYAVNNIGALLTTNQISENITTVLNYTPQIVNPVTNPLTDVTKWVLIEGSYTAGGGEKFLTIGNFNDDQHSDTVFIGGPYSAFYYIDDVYVGIDTTVNVSGSTLLGKDIKVYPNPANDNLQVEYQSAGQCILKICDILGKEVLCLNLDSDSYLKTISLEKLTGGIYFVRIFNKNEDVKFSEKLILIK